MYYNENLRILLALSRMISILYVPNEVSRSRSNISQHGLIPRVSQLSRLSLSLWPLDAVAVLKSLHNLQYLKLFTGSICGDELLDLPSTLCSLDVVTLSLCMAQDFSGALETHFTCLKTIRAENLIISNKEELAHFLTGSKDVLEEFSCLRTSDFLCKDFVDILERGYFRNLKRLGLKADWLEDETLEKIATHCSELLVADFSKCRRITGVGIKSLLSKAGSKIEHVDLTMCEAVSFDAVEWARARGVRVKYGNGQEMKAQRKVRY